MSTRKGTGVQKRGKQSAVAALAAAEQLLIDKGWAALSLRGVATMAGMRLGNLQYYYPTKRDLLRALLTRWESQYAERASTWEADKTKPEDRLMAVAGGFFDDLATPGGSVLFWELWAMAAHDEDAAEIMNSIYGSYRQAVADVLMEIDSKLPRKRAELKAAVFVSLLEGSSLHAGYGKQPPFNRALLKEEVLQAVRGLAGIR